MENIDQTTSLAQQLAKSGFSQTSIVRAIVELVGSYLGANTQVDGKLIEMLRKNNTAVSGIVPQTNSVGKIGDTNVLATNDDTYQNAA